MCINEFSLKQMSELATVCAIGFNGLESGALLFVSAVSVRTILKAIKPRDQEATSFIKQFFPIWWPFGRDLMMPLGLATTSANLVLYFLKGGMHNLVCAGLTGLIIPWTIVMMGEDISSLRSASTTDNDRYSAVTTFCRRHHVRAVLATSAFVISIAYNLKQ